MVLDGKQVAQAKIEELKTRVNKLSYKPKLVIIRVGDDPASGRYVANKIKKCGEVGIESEIIHYPEDVSQEEIENKIKVLNDHYWTTAILLQLPLSKHLDEDYLTSLITPEKDVDGFTEANMGKLVLGQKGNVACTPSGVMQLLKHYEIPIKGKNVLIINRSNIVGKPLAMLMLKEDATVTIAHSKTEPGMLSSMIWKSDIVITAIGMPNYFNYTEFAPHTTIIDVSINFDEYGKMCGDVRKSDYDKLVRKKCNITPVPGGVGVMTVMSLIEQTIEIAERGEKNR